MILTCPQCASRYTVDEASIPTQGRTVRCAGCGASWRAAPQAEEPLDLRPLAPDAGEREPEPEPAKPAAAAIPKTIRAQNQARKRTREAAVAGAVWGVLGALVLALIGGAALFRVEVVRLWPRTAGAYARVGLTVNPTGLAPENIQAGPGLKEGHAAVLVSGLVRNVETRPHELVPLRIALLDKRGRPLVRQVVTLAGARLQPGQTRPFAAAFLDPPAEAANIEVAFALEVSPRPKPPAAKLAEAHPPKLRGPAQPGSPALVAARQAEPLPASSPYALPPPAEANTHPRHES